MVMDLSTCKNSGHSNSLCDYNLEALSTGSDSATSNHMATIFIYVIYHLWKAESEAIFNDSKDSLNRVKS